jgi:2-(1,2-epoxy-1,2-dihydrophenyl)acetyl-CoA isomerase
MEDDVWRVTLDRPEAGNAIDLAMASDLGAALHRIPRGARAVLVDAAGPRFCVGGDVPAIAAAPEPGRFVRELAERWHEALRALLALEVPVVTAVHGAVAGAGIGLMAACDIVVCARSTMIRPGYIAVGLSPDGGTSLALTRALGLQRALDLMLTNGVLTVADAHLAGLVARVAEQEDLADSALNLARQLTTGPERAMVRTRQLARQALTRDLDEEARLIAESAEDAEGREGVRAFVERRPPTFAG